MGAWNRSSSAPMKRSYPLRERIEETKLDKTKLWQPLNQDNNKIFEPILSVTVSQRYISFARCVFSVGRDRIGAYHKQVSITKRSNRSHKIGKGINTINKLYEKQLIGDLTWELREHLSRMWRNINYHERKK